ncbi:hypothetical protein DERP_010408, partial [Dermatophagoides pteronyssinus]
TKNTKAIGVMMKMLPILYGLHCKSKSIHSGVMVWSLITLFVLIKPQKKDLNLGSERIDYHDYYNYIIKTFQQQQQFDDNLSI